MTPKEIFLEMLKPDGKPERQLKQYEALAMFLGDPVNGYLRGNRKRGTTSVDRWGTTILFEQNAPGPTPITDPEHRVLTDITRWREQVHIPDLQANCTEGWEAARKAAHDMAGDDRLCTVFMGTGIFEQCHFLMGFEDTLTNLYEHPQEMHELIDAICEYRIGYVKMLIDNIGPEVVFTHDDWGTKNALFMKPEMWREFFKEPYRKFYGYIRSRGCIAIHHADSYLAPIVEDMVDIGIQCWQGVLPENNIPELQKRLGGRMILMGGVGAAIDRPDSEEPEIREYVSNTLKICCPGGHFIPCITYGLSGTVFPHVDPFINDEIDKYNSVLHIQQPEKAPVPRRVFAAAADASAGNAEARSEDTLSLISQALKKGRKKQVISLTNRAIEEGIDPQDIINKGLMPGMAELGDDFSANRAFVPEMLMAARCMNASTEILKPLLAGKTTGPSGKVVIGTVKGDMHDIGKNLVKIMMEGSGLEVIDLGTDVAPEKFVETAKQENCDIIACSSLLTTCMNEMRSVVSCAADAGIRDKVKIMIGGAPTSQGFCDDIGADAYTKDAGEAARVAVALLG